ncbi:MAG: DUF3048 domain-containing protein [Patescibacteria group bacterium]
MKNFLKTAVIDLMPIKTIYAIAGIFFTVGVALFVWLGFRFYELQGIKAAVIQSALPVALSVGQPKCDFVRWYDGVCVPNETDRFTPLVAVMIENHPEARPLSGLSKAVIVYEAPVEAMFTRFLAIFPYDQEVFKVGPVRSARPYYLDWLAEYGNPMYLHVGGSPEALNLIKKRMMFDLDQYFHGKNFWRSADRSAPHNVYTSDDLWKNAWNDLAGKLSTRDLESWNFAERESCVKDCVREISISFLPPSYAVFWRYDSKTGRYARFQAGAPHQDQDGATIEADTIIVQRVVHEVLDEVGRLKIDTVGGGEALVFRDGYAVKGVWKKNDFDGRTRWIGENGLPIRLKPGKIWIEVVPEGKLVITN